MRIFRGLILLVYILWCVTPLGSCQSPLPGTAPFYYGDKAGASAETPRPDEPAAEEGRGTLPLPDPEPSAETEYQPPAKAETEPPPDPEPPSEIEPPEDPETPSEAEPPPDPEPPPEPDRKNTRLYVLMYHHFVPEGKTCNNWMVTNARFREDLQWLADQGWTTVLPGQLAAGEALPEKAVMLTFDDGYRSNYELAYPLLQEFQAKAVISIIVKNVDDQKSAFLTWDMCREMADSGLVEIGSHTYASHDENEYGIKRLKGESREEYEARIFPDLQSSIDLIEENLGAAPRLFAYPNGVKEAWAAGFIQTHFSLTVITRHGFCDVSKGLYSLKRCNVSMGVPLSKILPS